MARREMHRLEQIEFLNAVRDISEKQKLILINAFSKRIHGSRFSDGFDLLSEAVERVLSGSREWNRKVSIGAFLHEAMRSVLSVDTRGSRVKHLSFEDWMETERDEAAEYGISPEELAIRRQEHELTIKIIVESRQRLSGDIAVQVFFDRAAADMNAKEARRAFSIDEKAYKAARARVRRDLHSNANFSAIDRAC